MPAFDSILFDFDGVLADTEPVHWACWSHVLSGVGVTLTWNYYRDHCIGIDDRLMIRAMADQSVPPRSWEDLWGLYPQKKQMFRDRMLTNPPFEPGLGPLLASLHGTYKLAVVSSSSRAEIEPMLTAGGLCQYFDTIVGAESVTRYKPEPDPYLVAAERLQVRTPLVVEDSAAGIASGRAAGFEVLTVTTPAEVPALVARRLAL